MLQMKPLPNNDGITHINVDLKSKTALGRMLHQSHNGKFTHKKFGEFDSMDGFWGFVKTGCLDDRYRYMDAKTARHTLRDTKAEQPFVSNFYEVIMEANYYKCISSNALFTLMRNTALPFDMYYMHIDTETGSSLPVRPRMAYWYVLGLEYIRTCIKHSVVFSAEAYKELLAEHDISSPK